MVGWARHWNALIGFDHADDDEDNTPEEWFETHVSFADVEPCEVEDVEKEGSVPSVVRDFLNAQTRGEFMHLDLRRRGRFYNVFISDTGEMFGLEKDHALKDYSVLGASKLVFHVESLEDFTDRFAVRAFEQRSAQSVFLVDFEEKEVFFRVVESEVDKFEIMLLGDDQCFRLVVDINERASALDSLLYGVDHSECRGSEQFPGSGLGSWLLRLADQINTQLDMRFCELTDESTFQIAGGAAVSTQCAYSREHSGLSYYMSRFFLLMRPREAGAENDKKNQRKDIVYTNFVIAAFVDWWKDYNTHEDNKKESLMWACSMFPSFRGSQMIKYYSMPSHSKVQLHVPKNKNMPAFFYTDSTLAGEQMERTNEIAAAAVVVHHDDAVRSRKTRLLFSRALQTNKIDVFRLEDVVQFRVDLRLDVQPSMSMEQTMVGTIQTDDEEDAYALQSASAIWERMATDFSKRPDYNVLQLAHYVLYGALFVDEEDIGDEATIARKRDRFWFAYYQSLHTVLQLGLERRAVRLDEQTSVLNQPNSKLHMLQCLCPDLFGRCASSATSSLQTFAQVCRDVSLLMQTVARVYLVSAVHQITVVAQLLRFELRSKINILPGSVLRRGASESAEDFMGLCIAALLNEVSTSSTKRKRLKLHLRFSAPYMPTRVSSTSCMLRDGMYDLTPARKIDTRKASIEYRCELFL